MSTITLPRFADMHAHFRSEDMMHKVLPHTAKYCSHAIAMPNTRPKAILSADDIVWYQDDINGVLDTMKAIYDKNIKKLFTPLMTIELRDNTTPEIVRAAHKAGAVAAKAYPLGATTNSDMGMKDFCNVQETLKTMEEIGMLLLLHGEEPGDSILVTEREYEFIPTLYVLANNFPNLKIVLEHITTTNAVMTVSRLPKNVAATITGHHLYLTLNDVIGSSIRPHNYCMPIAKGFFDRDSLVSAAISGNPKFFLGSDSAPHMKNTKECGCGCAGVYSAPVLPSILVELFEKHNALDKLEGFTSKFGTAFYGVEQNTHTITLEKKSWVVPATYDGIVPFKAGEKLTWQLT